MNATPANYYVHADHLHRPLRMTNAAKSIVWSAEYQPWGAVQSLSGALTLDLRFPGQWFQLEAGLHYNWHRHYDPTIGRYTQPDPLGFVDEPSVFGYAGGSPLRSVDPLGFYNDILRCGLPKRRPPNQCNKEFPRDRPTRWYEANRYDANDPKCYQECAKKEFTSCQRFSVLICAPVGAVAGPVDGAGCFLAITYIGDRVTDGRCKYACNCLNNNEDAEAP